MSKCDICQKSESIGVACLPGVPVSCGFCEPCLRQVMAGGSWGKMEKHKPTWMKRRKK